MPGVGIAFCVYELCKRVLGVSNTTAAAAARDR